MIKRTHHSNLFNHLFVSIFTVLKAPIIYHKYRHYRFHISNSYNLKFLRLYFLNFHHFYPQFWNQMGMRGQSERRFSFSCLLLLYLLYYSLFSIKSYKILPLTNSKHSFNPMIIQRTSRFKLPELSHTSIFYIPCESTWDIMWQCVPLCHPKFHIIYILMIPSFCTHIFSSCL